METLEIADSTIALEELDFLLAAKDEILAEMNTIGPDEYLIQRLEEIKNEISKIKNSL